MGARSVLAACLWLAAAGAWAVELPCRAEPRFSIDSVNEKVIVIGEGAHGTTEIPAFVAGVLCNYAQSGRPVVLAWEFGREKQSAINAFMASDGSTAARAALVDAAFTSRLQDGRSSSAILEMLETARGLRAAGAQMAVEAVDYGESDVLLPIYAEEDRYVLMSQNRRQALMAINVEELSRHYVDHVVVFFTAHASKQVGHLRADKNGVPYESATLRLSRRIGLTSIGFQFAAGSSWHCKGPSVEQITCDAYQLAAGRGYDDAPLDRYVDLGPITASPPASRSPGLTARP